MLIKNEKQLEKYSGLLDELIFKEKLSKEEQEEVELLKGLIHDYEEKHYVFEQSDPIEIIKFMMDQHGL